MKASVWGPNTWNLLHIIAEKVYEDKFDLCKNDIYKMISLICSSIPCPICKENICDVRFDREFDNVNNPNDIKVHITLNKTISILFNDLSPGITIKNFKGIGVQVCALKDNEQCFMSGIRIGDIIVRINRIPSIEHSKAIKIINDCFNYKKKIDFEILI